MEYSSEVIALRERIKVGNEKLIKAWQQLREIADRQEEWASQFERWHKANELLSALCTQLETMGYEDCLYMENGKKVKKCLEPGEIIGCRVCPSKIPYWEKELMDLPGAGG